MVVEKYETEHRRSSKLKALFAAFALPWFQRNKQPPFIFHQNVLSSMEMAIETLMQNANLVVLEKYAMFNLDL